MTQRIDTPQTYLQPLTEADATAEYAAWMNDPEVNRYLETRHAPQSIDSCREFITACNNDPGSHLFGIFLRENDRHIGNAKIGAVNPHYRTGQLSLFIGDKSCWGKRLSVEIVSALTRYGFSEIGLERIESGCYASNQASLRMLTRVGFVEEGRRRRHVELDGERQDVVMMAILKNELPA